ncbi:MAG: Oxidoreductase, aldo/keto reductase family [uncultured Paraburkholderia sp.]|nr:MAG: Oxidoreductase, aldo/keto reductase family [uncultured Paraburkholderia sp.]CAH2923572.1 MAG: Oxidoreductase, aldo/keto reductase family [uncultured Paraburkholderia sp.]
MRYRLFGKHTGLRVSELLLGAGNFGTRWGHGAQPDEARRIINAYAEAGGNFIDTADSYQFGESEEILADVLAGRRDDFVLASKFSQRATPNDSILVTGNSRKAMVSSVEASLKRLKTDRLDLYWVHYADGVTTVEEIMHGFDDLVRAGKILYAGLSDFPAWRVARAATLAELRGTVLLAGLQLEYSLVEHSVEFELLPAGEGLGLGVVGWSPLGGGMLTGKYRKGERGRLEGFGGCVFQAENSPQRSAILDTLIAVADEAGVTPGEAAIAWVSAKGPFPIIGPRSVEQLQSNLTAKVTLSPQMIAKLDAASTPAPVFLHTMITSTDNRQRITGGKFDDFIQPPQAVA